MKRFNLEEYLKNPKKKVVTRGGLNVRIICTDRKSCDDVEFPIVCLIKTSRDEVIITTQKDGKFRVNGATHKYDLFFASTKKIGWINIYQDNMVGGVRIFQTKEEAIANRGRSIIDTIKIEWEE